MTGRLATAARAAIADRKAGARLSRIAFKVGLSKRPAHDLTYVGTAYGGWAVPVELIKPSWVCYTAGVGEDASLDLALAEIGCDVVAIDPTPRAIDHMKPLLAEYANLRLAPVAVWSHDTEVEFFPPADPSHVSYSVTNRQHTSKPLEVPARTLASIANDYGHTRVDLLKLDIEGAEYQVLESLDLRGLGVRVLCVEYHNDHGIRRMLQTARSVAARGYRVSEVHDLDVTYLDAGL